MLIFAGHYRAPPGNPKGYMTLRRMMDWKVAFHESRKHEHEGKNATSDNELNYV
jgi:hypothetical protein